MCYMKKEKEQIIGLSIFLFAHNLWCDLMQNDDLDSRKIAQLYNKQHQPPKVANQRFAKKPPFISVATKAINPHNNPLKPM